MNTPYYTHGDQILNPSIIINSDFKSLSMKTDEKENKVHITPEF